MLYCTERQGGVIAVGFLALIHCHACATGTYTHTQTRIKYTTTDHLLTPLVADLISMAVAPSFPQVASFPGSFSQGPKDNDNPNSSNSIDKTLTGTEERQGPLGSVHVDLGLAGVQSRWLKTSESCRICTSSWYLKWSQIILVRSGAFSLLKPWFNTGIDFGLLWYRVTCPKQTPTRYFITQKKSFWKTLESGWYYCLILKIIYHDNSKYFVINLRIKNII